MSELETDRPAAAGTDLERVDAGTARLAADEQDATGTAELLAIPPRADDLGAALMAARASGRKPSTVTAGLLAALLVCAGFIGGALAQRHWGGPANGRGGGVPNAFATNRAGRGGGAFSGFGGRSGTGAAGNAVTGTVTVVSGDTLYITAADGSVYTVKTSGSTAITVAQSGKLSQLKPGQTVVVAGSDDGSGDVTATSITAGGGTPPSGTDQTTAR
jgi:hypothetical protein